MPTVFNPRSLCGERQFCFAMSGWAIEFQSTLPAWGATCMSWTRCTTQAYFNPHSPYGERPRRPSRTVRMRYFNPRSPCGERLEVLPLLLIPRLISIHAPRVGSDLTTHTCGIWKCDFNPRSPCGERRPRAFPTKGTLLFQSTLPVWGATGVGGGLELVSVDFNPRSPCGGRLDTTAMAVDYIYISIHAPRVGGRPHGCRELSKSGLFQSTLPVWGATA